MSGQAEVFETSAYREIDPITTWPANFYLLLFSGKCFSEKHFMLTYTHSPGLAEKYNLEETLERE